MRRPVTIRCHPPIDFVLKRKNSNRSGVGDAELSQPKLALMVVAIGAGASIASHVNDSGFWLVNRYLGLTVPQTLRTWTVATTLLSLIGLVMTMLIGLFVT